jgi:hypothetical protein
MARPDELEQRRLDQLTDELEAQMATELPSRGVVVARVDQVEDVDRWRAAARRAARRTGVSIRTGLSGDGSTVWIVDHSPRHPTQDEANLERLVDALDRRFPGPGRPPLRVVEP